MRAGFGSEGSADGGGARLRAERERGEVGAPFCELSFSLPPIRALLCFRLRLGASWIADLPKGAKKRLASPGQECRGSAEASGRHGRCCGGWCLASWELVAMVLRHAS